MMARVKLFVFKVKNMTHNVAVIGANYGDEGKGHITQYMVNRFQKNGEKPLVVRYNGGAQAGHTVQTADGKRHVFSHFGSGTLLGAPTYWSHYCIVEPRTLLREFAELRNDFDIVPVLFIDYRAVVTTPFDVLFNIKLEELRGPKKHGSVGLGINETIERSQWPELRLTYGDAINMSYMELSAKMANIHSYYKHRAVDFHLPNEIFDKLDYAAVEMFYNQISTIVQMPNIVIVKALQVYGLLHSYSLVFEGAQGLALDEMAGDFPHVTRSRTGLHNIIQILRANELKLDETVYVTRAYATRHGDGPFDYPRIIDSRFCPDDKTNVPNPYQGTMRFGRFESYGDVYSRINADVYGNNHLWKNISIAITCLDQVQSDIRTLMIEGAKFSHHNIYTSNGPTLGDITLLERNY